MDNASASNKKLENALDYSVKLLNTGASIDECLKLYPNQHRELKGLLETVVNIKSAYPGYPELRPSKLYAKTARQKFIAAIEGGVPTPAPAIEEKRQPEKAPVLSIFRDTYRRFALASAAAAAALLIVTGGLVHAAEDSLPGSPLYGVKRATENARLTLAFDKESEAKLHYELAQRRITEAEHMAEMGKRGTAKQIVEEAKDSLAAAQKIAKVVPAINPDELEGKIESLSNKVSDQGVIAEQPGGAGGDDANTVAKAPSVAEGDTGGTLAVGDILLSPRDSVSSPTIRQTAAATSASDVTKSIASTMPFGIASINASGAYISPNDDGVKDILSISVSGTTSDRFNVELYNGSVKVAVIAKQASGRNLDFKWDGTDIDGAIVPDGKYAIRVADRPGQLASLKTEVTIDTEGPKIELIKPLNGEVTSGQIPQFVWSGGTEVVDYTIYLIPADPSAVEARCATGLTIPYYEPAKILNPGMWRWRIVAVDKAGNMSSSDYRDLLVIQKPEEKR